MKIKQLIIAVFTVLAVTLSANQAKAQVTWANATSCYYVGVFIKGVCPAPPYNCPLATSGYYYDVPDNYSWTENGPGLIDQAGAYQAPTNVVGLCLKDLATGQTYYVDFCRFGLANSVTFPAPNGCNFGPLTITWDLTVVPAVVNIS